MVLKSDRTDLVGSSPYRPEAPREGTMRIASSRVTTNGFFSINRTMLVPL